MLARGVIDAPDNLCDEMADNPCVESYWDAILSAIHIYVLESVYPSSINRAAVDLLYFQCTQNYGMLSLKLKKTSPFLSVLENSPMINKV